LSEITVNKNEYVWVEKYRHKKVSDIILPDYLKKDVQSWIKDGQIPNLMLISKSPGLGKTSLSHVIINELDAEAMFINASLESNIDTLRTKILGFVSTSSFDGRPKIVVLDEADNLNANSTQPALRGFIEEFSKNARFILTANYKDKLIEPLRDRLYEIDFDIIFNENKELIKDVYIRNKNILELEGVKFEPVDLKHIIKKYFPSTRKILMKLQQHTHNKVLDLHKESTDNENIIKDIVSSVLNKDFEDMRKQVTLLSDPSLIFTFLYENLELFPVEKRPPIVLTIAKYQANDPLVRDKLVNTVACLTEIMGLV
jgi:replication factor C small subunit